MEPLISVIVPVYNVKRYLKYCLDSIIGQEYKKLEIIIVDDGSTDGSSQLCDELEKIDSRILVYHKENGGLSDARNYGMERAKGDFLAFIDSDDVLHKKFFSALMQAQMETNADIAACDLSLFYDHKELEALHRNKYIANRQVFSRNEALREYFVSSGGRILYHGLCMKLYRKKLFSGLRFEMGRLHEDVYITYKLLDRAYKVVYINSPYYFYFQNNQGSICKNYGVKNFLDEAEAYKRMYQYFSEKNRVVDEVVFFLMIQYTHMFEMAYNLRGNPNVKQQMEKMKSWMRRHIEECNILSIKESFVVHSALCDIRLLHLLYLLRRIKGKIIHE